jgi:sulfide:quinone oxidoreductase
MAEVVVIGAGLSGTLMAYELLPQLSKDDHLTVVSQGPVYHFVPSNPWARSAGASARISKSILLTS